MSENFANDFHTLLNGSITSGTSVTVDTTTGSPAVPFRGVIQDGENDKTNREYVYITAKTSTVFTVTRAIEGTSNVNHGDNSYFAAVVTAGGFDQLRDPTGLYRPLTADAFDDEFDDGSIDGKWSITNNPSSPDSFSESQIPGCLWVGLPELGATDNFTTRVAISQSAPSGSSSWEFTAKMALTISADASATDGGEFCMAAIYLAYPTTPEIVGVGMQFNIGSLTNPIGFLAMNMTSSTWSSLREITGANFMPTEWIWFRIHKSTANAYTSSNNYNFYLSMNGLIWYDITGVAKTFTNAPTEIGLLFRRPKSVATTPRGQAIIDTFRKTG